MEPQELQIKDIYDVWYHPFWREKWFVYSSIILIIGLIVLVSYWLYKRNKKEIILTPQEQALEALYKLKKSEWESHKVFYIQLTTILKQYLQTQYKLPCIGKTDIEWLEMLQKNSQINEFVIQTIKTLLDGVVLIKFANQKAAQQQMQEALIKSIELVKHEVKT